MNYDFINVQRKLLTNGVVTVQNNNKINKSRPSMRVDLLRESRENTKRKNKKSTLITGFTVN